METIQTYDQLYAYTEMILGYALWIAFWFALFWSLKTGVPKIVHHWKEKE
jgi:hypothetical protein